MHARPTPKQRRGLGCTDCGDVYRTKADVPAQCREFTFYVVRSPHTLGGWELTDDESPFGM